MVKRIDFYEGEFDILDERLKEIVTKNNKEETVTWAERFKNQFTMQRNNIYELRRGIHELAGKVSEDAKNHAGKMETRFVREHGQLNDEVKDFEKIVNDLRHDFNVFLSNSM
jgi:phosphoglycerate-specific signal transduction histidine kinase